jgi:hypothetical protein
MMGCGGYLQLPTLADWQCDASYSKSLLVDGCFCRSIFEGLSGDFRGRADYFANPALKWTRRPSCFERVSGLEHYLSVACFVVRRLLSKLQ